MIRALLKLGANVNIANKKGNTPLHIAAAHNSSKALRLLVKHCNVDQRNIFEQTAVFFAARYVSLRSLRVLEECGADMNLIDHLGRTAFEVALDELRLRIGNSKRGRTRSYFSILEMVHLILPHVTHFRFDGPIFPARYWFECLRDSTSIKEEHDVVKSLMRHGLAYLWPVFCEHLQPKYFDQSFIDLYRLMSKHQCCYERLRRDLSIQFSRDHKKSIQFIKPTDAIVDLSKSDPIRQSLQEICCCFIRDQVRKPLWKGIDTLPLPPLLKDYLKLKHLQ